MSQNNCSFLAAVRGANDERIAAQAAADDKFESRREADNHALAMLERDMARAQASETYSRKVLAAAEKYEVAASEFRDHLAVASDAVFAATVAIDFVEKSSEKLDAAIGEFAQMFRADAELRQRLALMIPPSERRH